MRFFKAFLYIYENYLMKLTGLVFIISTILISYQVVGRKFFGMTISGYDQMIIWSSIICIYLMIGLGLKQGRHLRVTVLVKSIKRDRIRFIIEFIGNFISVFYIFIASAATWVYMLKSKRVGSKAVMFDIPTWIVYLFITIGLVLMLLFYIERMVGFYRYYKYKDEEIIDVLNEDGN